MPVPNLWRDARTNFVEISISLMGWLLLAPLAALPLRRRDWIAVIGRESGAFVDNTKYFYIDVATDNANGLRIVHITERKDVAEAIAGEGGQAFVYPSLRAAWFLMRCGLAVVDSVEWYKRARRFLLVRARLVQLWHGVGFKRIELDKWRNEAEGKKFLSSRWLLWPRMVRRYLYGRAPMYDAVATTSVFYRDNVFTTAFRSRHFPITGYPRNAFANTHPLAWVNVDVGIRDRLNEWAEAGRKPVFLAPTFRDSRATPLGLDDGKLAMLDAFCEKHGFEFVFKFHPYERGASRIAGRHLHVVDPCSDAYPLLPLMHALVTDYSSIYMDFLLLDRPVLFMTPDLEKYISSDRGIQFDFESMTPGPKFRTWDELLAGLLQPEPPEWRDCRHRLARMAFDGLPQNMATNQLLRFFTEQGWIEPAVRG
ncbi:CDP-glycerol glycerophosphotransferase family protein [Stenotrophomonas sp. NLF4-10]|uniref:CDP-glycerol glycerophosphotransferase family protein n=1 Tax=Stenotrophomonas sp. NLF4-10 TaxID=2918754 RepID=UPI001EFA9F8E|nr:CDP-glycerol glycerophosphotransferase family protein [Stenotrophomonas sp. NLF4-10]MCG8277391.1 CDP-glycerol glycerophosphotransferase family protein [Stenotrophomonas sp. NLF4-10]